MNKVALFKLELFTKDGLLGMLETSDHKAVDRELPLFKAFANRICGNEEKPDVMKLFKMYADQLCFPRREHKSASWRRDELTSLSKGFWRLRRWEGLFYRNISFQKCAHKNGIYMTIL